MILEYVENQKNIFKFPFYHRKTKQFAQKKGKDYFSETGELFACSPQSFRKREEDNVIQFTTKIGKYIIYVHLHQYPKNLSYSLQIYTEQQDEIIEDIEPQNLLECLDFFIDSLNHAKDSFCRSNSFCYYNCFDSRSYSEFRKFSCEYQNSEIVAVRIESHFYYYEFNILKNKHTYHNEDSYKLEKDNTIFTLNLLKNIVLESIDPYEIDPSDLANEYNDLKQYIDSH